MSDALANSDTPRKSQPFSGGFHSGKPVLEKIRREKRLAMKEVITFLAPDQFLANLLPDAGLGTRDTSKDKAVFEGLPSKFNQERDMYAPIMKALNEAGICPGYSFVATPYKPDDASTSKEAVDGGLYPAEAAPQATAGSKKSKTPSAATDWSEIEVAIECKNHYSTGDPFDIDTSNGVPLNRYRRKVFGQILSYAHLISDHQHRIFQFMVLFIGRFSRLVFVDRASIFVSKRFDYRNNPAPLLDLFWRLGKLRAMPARRGHDPTAERISHDGDSAERMTKAADRTDQVYDYPRVQFKKSLDRAWPWWRLTIPCEVPNGAPVNRDFLVGKPHFIASGVSGRGTHGYIAIEDKEDAPFVYLKDSWRVVHEDIDKEGKTLEDLAAHGVKYVPTLLCHGDLPDQNTRVRQNLWKEYNDKHKQGKPCPIKEHTHYRLVVKEVGRPLEDFVDGAELLWIIYCALIAHEQAYTKAKIIHRDISAGNILIYPGPSGHMFGLLNDWELSKQLANERVGGRQLNRTGTWQFLSVRALDNPSKKIILQDELEAFFHVLLYMVIRFLPHNCPASRVGGLLYQYFDDYVKVPKTDRIKCGALKRTSMSTGKISLISIVDGDEPTPLVIETPGPASSRTQHPINDVINTALSWFKAYMLTMDAPRTEPSINDPLGKKRAVPMDSVYLDAFAARGLEPDAQTTDSVAQDVSTQQVLGLASKLESHGPMIALVLQTFATCRAVQSDKENDKKPKNGYSAFGDLDDAPPSDSGTRARSTELTGSEPESNSGVALEDNGTLPLPEPEASNAEPGDSESDTHYSGNSDDMPLSMLLSKTLRRRYRGTSSGSRSGKRPYEDDGESVDIGDRPTTPKRHRPCTPPQ